MDIRKKERNSSVRKGEIDRSLVDEWFTMPFDDLPGSRSMRNWSREIEDTMQKQIETLMRKAASGISANPVVYGWSLKVVDGKPEFREFGNVKLETAEREPVVDVLNTTDGFTVVVELPGVEKSEINVETTATELFVETNGEKKYKKSVKFTEEIDSMSVTSNFKNGILSVTLKKSNGNKRKVSVL